MSVNQLDQVMKYSFAPALKHFGKTPEEQLEKNQPLMEWLKRKLAEEITEEEARENDQHWEAVKKIIDSYRPSGQKLFSKE